MPEYPSPEESTFTGYSFKAGLRYDGQTPKECFRYAALCCLSWLRQQLAADELPDELKAPAPKEFVSAADAVLRSVHFSGVCELDIAAEPKEGRWSFTLRRPDAAQPGRFFVTVASLCVSGRDVLLDTRVDVDCRGPEQRQGLPLLRPEFLRTLFANNRVRLRQGGLLNYQKAHTVPYWSALKHLMQLLNSPERLMPVIVLTYTTRPVNIQRLLARLDARLGLTDLPGSFSERLDQLDLFP